MIISLARHIRKTCPILALFLYLCSNAYSQGNNISKIKYPDIDLNRFSFSKGQIYDPVPHTIPFNDRNLMFLDSLRKRVSKNPFTRKLFEIVVVPPSFSGKERFNGTAESLYLPYSGKKIRKIDVTRLSVFGSDIDNPASYRDYRARDFLNKTHINTLDIVIRNNLLP